MGTLLLIIGVMLLLSAFFSGMEIAFLSSNKLRIEIESENRSVTQRLIEFFLTKPGMYITTILVGNNVAIVIYGMAIAKILDPLIAKYITASVGGILAIDTIVATIIVLITAEFLPKAMCRMNPNGVFSSLYWLFIFFYWLSLII